MERMTIYMEEIFNILFGWKELTLTNDESKYYLIRNILTENNILNKSSIKNESLRSGHRCTLPGSKQNSMYYIYVKKMDYEKGGKYNKFIIALVY